MNKQLRDAIGRAATRVNLAAGILTSILPEVIRSNVARILSPYLDQPQQQPQNDAPGCPFSGGAAVKPETHQAETGKCPFTGQSATTEEAKTDAKADATPAAKTAAKTDSTKTTASGTKTADAAKPAPAKSTAKAVAPKKPVDKKPAETKPTAKTTAQAKTAPTAKKQSAPKPAAKTTAKTTAKKPAPKKEQPTTEPDIVVGDLTTAQLKKLKRTELYEIAQELEIPGRKDMRKAELFDAIQKELKLV